jgi:uncharacterized protein involved in exopolysaccharide biosynthesis
MSDQNINPSIEDEISLKDIVDFLVESWKTIVVGGVAGGLLGLGNAVTTPAKYQATANIQVAKIAGADVEAPATLLEKLNMPMFYSQKTYAACNLMEKLEPGEVIAKTLKPTLAKTAPIITISFQEKSPEDAKKCLEGVLNDVRFNQNILAKPIFESKTNQLLNLKLKLESAERIVKTLPKNNAGFDFSDSKFSASTLLLATTLSKENEIQDLRTAINDLEIALVEPQTREAFLTTPIYAPGQKVSPKRDMIVLVGLMAGLFIGLLLMMGKRAYGAYKASKASN